MTNKGTATRYDCECGRIKYSHQPPGKAVYCLCGTLLSGAKPALGYGGDKGGRVDPRFPTYDEE